MVGDSLDDVAGARNVGMISVAIGHRGEAIADYSIAGLPELLSIVKDIDVT
jgi:FMN phosphatase YigB (HAD superfamily)